MHRLLTIAALAAILTSTNACGALVVGYLAGDAIASNKRVEACRENLRITNEQRLRDGKDLFPDQCK
jgi:hypothetical protein